MIVAVKDIVRPSVSSEGRHTANRDFCEAVLAKRPAHLLEINVDDGAAGVCFGLGGGSGYCKCMRSFILFAQFGKFCFEVGHFFCQGFTLFGLLGKFILESFPLFI